MPDIGALRGKEAQSDKDPPSAFALTRVKANHDPLVSYSNIMGSWPGSGNIAVNPAFALPGFWTADSSWIPGDYHLMSELKRWDPDSLTWVPDTLSSPCIDAGDPNACVHEPPPNGTRINMGAYGGTDQASCSFTSVLAL